MATVDEEPALSPLIGAERIQQAVRDLVPGIRAACEGLPAITALVLLEGARPFARDLLATLDDPRFRAQPLRVSSYFGTTASSGRPDWQPQDLVPLAGAHVLILDDIYDTGRTLHAVRSGLAEIDAASIRTCVMFAKDRPHEQPVPVDFVGLTLPDRFVVGYGLDYEGRYRDLPYVATWHAPPS